MGHSIGFLSFAVNDGKFYRFHPLQLIMSINTVEGNGQKSLSKCITVSVRKYKIRPLCFKGKCTIRPLDPLCIQSKWHIFAPASSPQLV